MLAVNMKSGCHGDPLDTASAACDKLRAQLPILERWIDARASEEVPFVVLGDFNRRMPTGEEFWAEIDDGDPPNSDLGRATEGRRSECWGGEFPEYIDHIVFDRTATAWVVPGSFSQLVYEAPDTNYRLPDHCPVNVTIDVPEG